MIEGFEDRLRMSWKIGGILDGKMEIIGLGGWCPRAKLIKVLC